MAAALLAVGCKCGGDCFDVSEGRTDAGFVAVVSWVAIVAAGAGGMFGFVYLFVDEADRADSADHRGVVQGVWDCPARSVRTRDGVSVSHSGTDRVADGAAVAWMQDGISRAVCTW